MKTSKSKTKNTTAQKQNISSTSKTTMNTNTLKKSSETGKKRERTIPPEDMKNWY